jgi:hypothetical protein
VSESRDDLYLRHVLDAIEKLRKKKASQIRSIGKVSSVRRGKKQLSRWTLFSLTSLRAAQLFQGTGLLPESGGEPFRGGAF